MLKSHVMQGRKIPFHYFMMLFSCLFIVSACATQKPAQKTAAVKENLEDQPPASLRGSYTREGFFSYNWEHFRIAGVDRNTAENQFFRSEGAVIEIKPGRRDVAVIAEFDRADMRECPCTALFNLKGTFVSEQDYRVKGEVRGENIAVWIEDETTGKKISSVRSKPYAPTQKPLLTAIIR